jgi:putative oxidoreductase
VSGSLNHFRNVDVMTGYAQFKGVPAPRVAVLGSGILLLLGGLSMLSGFQPTFGVLVLILFYLPVTFKMHDFWNATDATAKQNDMLHFLKNVALLSSTLMFLGIPQPWPYSLGG